MRIFRVDVTAGDDTPLNAPLVESGPPISQSEVARLLGRELSVEVGQILPHLLLLVPP
jgi:hypothetical protein